MWGGEILHDLFVKIGYKEFRNYIPHRYNEGYGLNINALNKLKLDGYSVMITVDLGITNIEEVAHAEGMGMNVILTDHHLPLRLGGIQQIPNAYAVINTKQDNCAYNEKMLCGCATAWKLAYAFLMKYGPEFGVHHDQAKWWLDMVGISTIADMVPLVGENRVLATYGLNVLNKSKRQGLLQLLSFGKEVMGSIDEESVSFTIAPRLNSASRMSDPIIAFHALVGSSKEAIDAAYELEMLNKQRKSDVLSANSMVNIEEVANDKIVLVGDSSWSPGILGLISQKIVEKTKKTAFVWGGVTDDGIVKGSVRSGVDKYRANVVQLMSDCQDLLLHFGGHEEAGGFVIRADNLPKFKLRLQELYKECDMLDRKEQHVIRVKSEDLTANLLEKLDIYKPYGVGNPAPIFALEESFEIRRFGLNGKHLELTFAGKNKLKAIKWNVDDEMIKSLISGQLVVGNLKRDKYRGGVQFMITDIKIDLS